MPQTTAQTTRPDSCNYSLSLLREIDPRLARKIKVDDGTDCWLWTGGLSTGYGTVTRNSVPCRTHRYVYELLVGPIPAGLHLDHLCLRKPCCNPLHLEPVTPAENSRRAADLRTGCVYGHRYDSANTYIHVWVKDGGTRRVCRRCKREYISAWREAQKRKDRTRVVCGRCGRSFAPTREGLLRVHRCVAVVERGVAQ